MNITNFNLNNLVYFAVLMEERQVSRAAKRVGLSQPGMSHVLKQLRILFDDPLFVGGKGGLVPTFKATQLLDHLYVGLQHIEEAINSNKSFDPRTLSTTFRILASDYCELTVLPALNQFLTQYFPSIQIEVLATDGNVDARHEDSWDLKIGFPSQHIQHPFFEETLFEDNYVCIGSAQNAAFDKKITTRQFFSLDHAIVAPKEAMFDNVDHAIKVLKQERSVRMKTFHFSTLPFLIGTTDLIATVPARLGALFEKSFLVKSSPLPFNVPSMKVKQIWHQRTHNSASHRWLREQVRLLCSPSK